MKKKKVKETKKKAEKAKKTARIKVCSELELYNAKNFVSDHVILASLSDLPPSRRDWIETTRYGHQQKANIYEKKVGAFLISQKIRFIHQAPFVIDGKIYFLDFFIPNKRLAIEVDGYSHNPMFQKEYDQIRDDAFSSIGIKTVRITNNEVKDDKILETSLKLRHVI